MGMGGGKPGSSNRITDRHIQAEPRVAAFDYDKVAPSGTDYGRGAGATFPPEQGISRLQRHDHPRRGLHRGRMTASCDRNASPDAGCAADLGSASPGEIKNAAADMGRIPK